MCVHECSRGHRKWHLNTNQSVNALGGHRAEYGGGESACEAALSWGAVGSGDRQALKDWIRIDGRPAPVTSLKLKVKVGCVERCAGEKFEEKSDIGQG